MSNASKPVSVRNIVLFALPFLAVLGLVSIYFLWGPAVLRGLLLAILGTTVCTFLGTMLVRTFGE